MADVNNKCKANEVFAYALVANIPRFYHASDLRNYFSQFLELGGFDCFHFRHRPEIIKSGSDFTVSNDGCQATDVNSGLPVASGGKDDSQCYKGKTMCCVIRLLDNKLDELCKMYNRKCWLDRKGESVRSVCRISRIKVADTSNDCSRFKTRGEQKTVDDSKQAFTQNDLLSLPELHPPALMPHGNVGTPTAYFLKQIQLCRLPASIIAKLGLTFPRTRSNRKYGSVPFTYHGTAVCELPAEDISDVTSGKGNEILSEDEVAAIMRQEKTTDSSHTASNEDEEKDDSNSASDADECEEWERHEAFHDDPSNQERNAERLYESEMEIVWEKGGPGIVWYTDAQFWDELNGTEEEKDVDEWDIDMSVYYDPDSGDKDARDMMTMRRDIRRRGGHCDTNSDGTVIGKFEKHTKGIGRKLMTKYGWKEGQGLGSTIKGIVDALDDEGGQKPYDRRGFGYHGEKLPVFGGPSTIKRPRADDTSSAFRITTIYDNPSVTDPEEQLMRRVEPTHLKYRSKKTTCIPAKKLGK